MKKPDPAMIDPENPEWGEAEFQRARPASAVLPHLFSPEVVTEMLRPRRGRPPKEVVKEAINIRLSPDVVEAFRAMGKGWQTRMDQALREWLASHAKV